jgi:UDP-hydrolysing UDP-N-acetyl-D-glucosamine 2-epimerase
MRTLTAITVSPADYGILLPILRTIDQDPDLRLRLLVSGMHLAPTHGLTYQAIEADEFTIDERVEMLLASDTPEGIAKSMGLGAMGFAQAFARQRPDILLVLGDSAGMHAAVTAALPFAIPVAHIHGGEVSRGTTNDALRHSITKLSQLHFVATEACARRVVQMGEEPWRVTVSGAPILDNLRNLRLLSEEELESRLGISLKKAPLLVRFHPVPLEQANTAWHVSELLAALNEVNLPIVFIRPQADTQGRPILKLIEEFAATRPNVSALNALEPQIYCSLMNLSAALVGNSTSGLVEAPTFRVPVVNIGKRQEGRCRAGNVLDVSHERSAILQGIRRAIQPDFRAGLRNLVNPFGIGNASEKIVTRLKQVPLDGDLLRKQFHEIEPAEQRLNAA